MDRYICQKFDVCTLETCPHKVLHTSGDTILCFEGGCSFTRGARLSCKLYKDISQKQKLFIALKSKL